MRRLCFVTRIGRRAVLLNRDSAVRLSTRWNALVLALLLGGSMHAASKLNVMATTEDLAALAHEIGGDRINIDSIAKGYQDPHFVEAKPSFLLKLQKADLLL